MSEETKKHREFDVYWDGHSSEAHICENDKVWSEGCGWAKPDMHVVEKSPTAQPNQSEEIKKLITFLTETDNGHEVVGFSKSGALKAINHAMHLARLAKSAIEKSPHTTTNEDLNNGTPTLDHSRTTTNCDRCGKPNTRNINALPDSLETSWDIERDEAARHQLDMERLTLTAEEKP